MASHLIIIIDSISHVLRCRDKYKTVFASELDLCTWVIYITSLLKTMGLYTLQTMCKIQCKIRNNWLIREDLTTEGPSTAFKKFLKAISRIGEDGPYSDITSKTRLTFYFPFCRNEASTRTRRIKLLLYRLPSSLLLYSTLCVLFL